MKTIYPEPQSIEESFDSLTQAWKAKDFDSCKPILTGICNNMSPDDLEGLILTSPDTAMGVFDLFVKTDLGNAPDGTPAREFYLKIVDYIINNETHQSGKLSRKPSINSSRAWNQLGSMRNHTLYE